ncbi:hypothetical protein Esi_1030_0001 [Ectocarpus siliculosus]|uniref:BRCT domain-containing protein n=1 Tax=Ectocarpus siliculosus TaxID=2880 RepID=D7FGY7_ECTSI|nr:hypothetical protein Esi_1030_0001 [Ectocarpus siliculosus]|eukprot:CBJ34116.1 hypothetical protein Esi_1030_0001 [Ectocarpus siliculosus]
MEVGGSGDGGGAVVPEARDCTRDRCQEPTADQLNDPVFRGRMKARTRAAKAAAAAATASIGGNPASGNGGGSALTGARCQPDKRIHQVGWVDDVGRGLQGKRGGGGGVEQRQAVGFNGWMSSRRQDWGLDDVGLPAAQSRGVGSAAPSASRLSRSKTAPSPSKSGGGAASPPQPPPPPAPAARAKPTAERLTGPSLGGKSGGARASAAVGFAGGRGAKRGADGGSSGGGDGGSGCGCNGGTRPRSIGVGPRSHAKKKSRGNKEGVGEDAGAVAAIPAVPAAAVGSADSTRADKTLTSSPSPRQRKKTSGSVRCREVSHEGGRGIPAKKCCRQQRARSSAAAVAVSPVTSAARQHHRSHGPRGEKMLRQASVQAAGTAAAAPTPTTENVRDSPAAAAAATAAGRIGPFFGLSLVLVGLPDDVHREVDRTIVACGGRVLEDLPPPKTRGGLALRRPAAGAEVVVAAADASRRGRKRDIVTAAASAEGKEDVVVVVSVPSASRLPRYVLAIATGTPLLHHLWVSDSAAEARPLPASPYLLPGAREASRRRQAASSAGTAAAGMTTAAAKAGGGHKASHVALAKAVSKTGTPLMGMAIGVAHPSPTTCERWAQVLRAAGAQTVLRVTGDPLLVLLAPREETAVGTRTSSPSRGTWSCSRGRRTAGASSSSSSSLQAEQLAGLDCVLCDFPGAWNGSGGGDDGECRAATGRRPVRGNGGVPAIAGR